MFICHRYDSTLNFNSGPDGMDEPVSIDETFFNFFSTLNSKLSSLSVDQKWSEDDLNLNKEFEKLKSNVCFHVLSFPHMYLRCMQHSWTILTHPKSCQIFVNLFQL